MALTQVQSPQQGARWRTDVQSHAVAAADGRSWLGRFAPLLDGWLGQLSGRARRGALANGNGAQAQLAELMRDQNDRRYLDPAALVRFGLSPLVARMVVEGFISGLHKSPFHGFSVEFADHREYVPGDDLKFLDWKLFGRTDHYYIKRYEEETNVRCQILLDQSASMAFGTGALTKWDYSCFLATCLSYLMIKQQDAVGLTLFGDGPGLALPPRSRSSHLRRIMQALMQNPPQGKTDFVASLRAAAVNLKRRGMVVLISDLIDDPEQTLRAIKLIGSRKHDVVVFHVQDAVEIDFQLGGPTLLLDMETGEEMEIDPASLREGYLEQMRQLGEFYRKGLTEVGIDYHPIDTRQPYDHALSAYLQRRAQLAK